jgi:hypothetical protein
LRPGFDLVFESGVFYTEICRREARGADKCEFFSSLEGYFEVVCEELIALWWIIALRFMRHNIFYTIILLITQRFHLEIGLCNFLGNCVDFVKIPLYPSFALSKNDILAFIGDDLRADLARECNIVKLEVKIDRAYQIMILTLISSTDQNCFQGTFFEEIELFSFEILGG